jgi:hypothetical protein
MRSKEHNVTVSAIIHKLFPGFVKHEPGDTPDIIVAVLGETIDVCDNEVGEIVFVDNSATASAVLKRIAEQNVNVASVPSTKEIEGYDITGKDPIPASRLILRRGEL